MITERAKNIRLQPFVEVLWPREQIGNLNRFSEASFSSKDAFGDDGKHECRKRLVREGVRPQTMIIWFKGIEYVNTAALIM